MNNKILGTWAAIMAFGPLAALADPITYEYDGGAFTSIPGDTPAGVTGISATFTVDLLANVDQTNVAVSSWSISDGLTVIDQFNSDYSMIFNRARTDAFGDLTGFAMQVGWLPFNTIAHPVPVGVSHFQEFRWGNIGSESNQSQICVGANPLPDGRCNQDTRADSDNVGALSVTTVPEPGTLTLFGIGLLGLGFARRKAA